VIKSALMSPDLLYGLVLLAAIAHAAWNTMIKSAPDRVLMMAAIRLVGLVFGLAVVPFVPWPGPITWMWLGLASITTFAYYALLLHSYRIGDLNLVYPVARGSAPVLLALIAYLTIDEQLTLAEMTAIALISGGILTLIIGRSSPPMAVVCALATGTSIAGYSFLGGLGVRSSDSVFTFQAWLEILTGVGMLAFSLAQDPRRLVASAPASWAPGFLAGILSLGGYLAFLAAAKVLPLGPVSALRECSLIFGTLIGTVLLKEAFGLRRMIGAGLVTSGVIALALSTAR
jgi:drug/metabolite transporter (DMT)-like permease